MKYILFFVILISINSKAQYYADSTKMSGQVMSSTWREHGMVAGLNYNGHLWGELGYFNNYVEEIGGFPLLSTQVSLGTEFSYNQNFILAPKVKARLHLFVVDLGLSSLWYSNFKDSDAFVLRPEIGIGGIRFDLNYGYNLKIYQSGNVMHGKHFLMLKCYINIKQKYLHFYDQDGIEVFYRE